MRVFYVRPPPSTTPSQSTKTKSDIKTLHYKPLFSTLAHTLKKEEGKSRQSQGETAETKTETQSETQTETEAEKSQDSRTWGEHGASSLPSTRDAKVSARY